MFNDHRVQVLVFGHRLSSATKACSSPFVSMVPRTAMVAIILGRWDFGKKTGATPVLLFCFEFLFQFVEVFPQLAVFVFQVGKLLPHVAQAIAQEIESKADHEDGGARHRGVRHHGGR